MFRRRKSRSTTRYGGGKRRLRFLAAVHNYAELDDLDDDDLDLDPGAGEDEGREALQGKPPQLVRRRFLPKGKRTFFRGASYFATSFVGLAV